MGWMCVCMCRVWVEVGVWVHVGVVDVYLCV